MKKSFTALIFVLLALLISIPIMAADLDSELVAPTELVALFDVAPDAVLASDRMRIAQLVDTNDTNVNETTGAIDVATNTEQKERRGHRMSRYALLCYT